MLLPGICCFLLATAHVVGGANILALLTTPSHSHHFWNRVLMLELAARGHHVTVLSPDPEKKPVPNHKDLVIEGVYEHLKSEWDYEALNDEGPLESLVTLFRWGIDTCKYGMSTNGVKSLMASKNVTYDLIIVEVSAGDCYLGFVHYFNYPPVLGINAFTNPTWASSMTGSPEYPAYMPNLMTSYSDKMTFGERVINTFFHCYTLLTRKFYYMPQVDAIVRKQFGESVPPVSEIEQLISLIMVNAHYSMDYPRPLTPALIHVGGIHIKEPKPLPQDLQKYMDEAPNGVIFFSLGSNIRSDKLGPEKINSLLEAFKELPQRVLWKFESDNLVGLPSNVKLGKWLPQSDILGHPNVRLFITHGGLLSMQEAVYHGVPVLGIPFFGDQHMNIHKAVARGVGETVEFAEITKEKILHTINKVVNSNSYRDNMKTLSAQFRDQPETPLERAVFWTEYVIKHRGATHLRSAAIDLPWYQYLLLDVITVILLGTTVALVIAFWTMRKVVHFVLGRTKNKDKQQ